MHVLPNMDFRLEVISLKERADEREESILRDVSIEPLLVNRDGFELMDGYTRYTVLKRYSQKEVYVYVGNVK